MSTLSYRGGFTGCLALGAALFLPTPASANDMVATTDEPGAARSLVVSSTVATGHEGDAANAERMMMLDETTAYLDLRADVQSSGAVTFSVMAEGSKLKEYSGGQLVIRDGHFEDLTTVLSVDWSGTNFSQVDVYATVETAEIDSGSDWSLNKVGPVAFVNDVVTYELRIDAGGTLTNLTILVEQLDGSGGDPDDIVIDAGPPGTGGSPPPPG